MATKQNMYVGATKEMNELDQKIEEAVVSRRLNEDKTKKIGVSIVYIDKALKIRDAVAELKGALNTLLKGLDKDSPEEEKYRQMRDKCTTFLNDTRGTIEDNMK